MKLFIDPMPALRAAAKTQVDAWFNGVASTNQHRDAIHPLKRAAAQKLLAGDTTVADLDAEAALRRTSPRDLAALIVSKPDELAARELHRQKAFAKIETIAAAADLEAFLKDISKVD